MEQSRTILVIDDDPTVLAAVENFLSEQDYRVVTASLWTEAIEQLQNVRPDAVLLDLRLPTVQGETLLEFIRETHPDLPVVIISADISPSEMGRLSDLGAGGFIRKPFETSDLMVVLEQVLLDLATVSVTPSPQQDQQAEATGVAKAPASRPAAPLPPNILPGSGVQGLDRRARPTIALPERDSGIRRKRVRKKKRHGRNAPWLKRMRKYVLIAVLFSMIAVLLLLIQQGLNTGYLIGFSLDKSAKGEQAPE